MLCAPTLTSALLSSCHWETFVWMRAEPAPMRKARLGVKSPQLLRAPPRCVMRYGKFVHTKRDEK